jgi:hypothetical protein
MNARSFRDRLVEAGLDAGTDKISNHHYESCYARCLERFQEDESFAMLEIGYGSGAGVEFWTSVFPNAFVYCFDRDHEDQGDSYKVLKADQSDLNSLVSAIDEIVHPISIVIDDGSHHPSHQLLTFSYLFQSLLTAGGIYIVEDIETSYWRCGSLYGYLFNYGLSDPWSTIEAFKIACDYVNRRYLSIEDKSFLEYRMMSVGLDPESVGLIESILFSRNLIVLNKTDQVRGSEEPYQNAIASARF